MGMLRLMNAPRKHRAIAAVVGALGCVYASTGAYGAKLGMFLCRSPVVAGDFWNGLMTARNAGVTLNREIAASIARKHGCVFVASPALRPINYVSGEMEITGGRFNGWAAPQLYIIYVNEVFSHNLDTN